MTGKRGSRKNPDPAEAPERRVRADAQRNIEALLEAAMAVFMSSGVDAPVREIAEKAGVGVGTLYRHFPQRPDLVVAVFRDQVDACAAAAATLAEKHTPVEALERWVQRYVEFIATKRGLGAALHSGDPAFEPLPDYFRMRLEPALQGLLKSAVAAGEIRKGFEAWDLLLAIPSLCSSPYWQGSDQGQRMVTLLVDGLRYGARARK